MPVPLIAAGVAAAGSIAASAIGKSGRGSGQVGGYTDADFQNAQGNVYGQMNAANSLSEALRGSGIANEKNVFTQAQGLANQYNVMSQGQGPNPAQNMLNQATGNNVAQQAALMAGQRGAGANAGLIARQAAQQGANIQQQATGQAATLGAQQQVAAMQGLQGQQQLMGQLAGNQVNQSLAGNQLAGQLALGNQGNMNQLADINAGVGNENVKRDTGLVGGAVSGIGSAIGSLGAKYDGGMIEDSPCSSKAGKFLHKAMKSGGKVPGKSKVDGDSPQNDTVPTMLSPGEIVVPRSAAGSPDKAAAFAKAVSMRSKKGKK